MIRVPLPPKQITTPKEESIEIRYLRERLRLAEIFAWMNWFGWLSTIIALVVLSNK